MGLKACTKLRSIIAALKKKGFRPSLEKIPWMRSQKLRRVPEEISCYNSKNLFSFVEFYFTSCQPYIHVMINLFPTDVFPSNRLKEIIVILNNLIATSFKKQAVFNTVLLYALLFPVLVDKQLS